MLEAEKVFMNRALHLAQQGAGLVSPNPMVGAVLVKDGRIVGEGFHLYEKKKHAETYAIEQAGKLSRGSTLYCSLEPCCHHGRTPPCTDSVIAAGISRAVIATKDPDPRVNGKGIAQLREAGIEVEVGLCEDPAEHINEAYSKFITTRTPFLHGVIEDECAQGDPNWVPSSLFVESAWSRDAIVIGRVSEAALTVLAQKVAIRRHRREVIVATERTLEALQSRVEKLSEVLETVSLGNADSEINPGPGGHLRIVSGNTSNVEQLRVARTLPELLELLGKINVSSALLIGGPFELSDPSNFELLDKLTLLVPDRVAHRALPRMSIGDLEFDFEDVRIAETQGYVEMTGYPRLLEIA